MAVMLTRRGFAVTALLGTRASRRAILMAMDSFAIAAADLCVLYFSGHGLHGSRALDRGLGYFAPYDFDPDDTTLAVPLNALATAFEQEFRAKQAFALFDCCYAGVVATVAINTNWSPDTAAENWRLGIKPAEDGAGRALAQPDDPASGGTRTRALIAACPGNVKAREFDDLGHGAVTFYALEGWQGRAANLTTGLITDVGLYSFISDHLGERKLPPLARAAQIGDVILDAFPTSQHTGVTSTLAWPPNTRLIDAAVLATARFNWPIRAGPRSMTGPASMPSGRSSASRMCGAK